MKITIASLSNTGNRQENQDVIGHCIGSRSACFIVCDGIAGNPGGELAAKLAINTILDNFDGEAHFDSHAVRQFIIKANHAILEQQQKTTFTKMGTTIVCLFIDRDYNLAYWAHVGDSRLYLFHHGILYNVTIDHSLVEQMRQAGYQTTGVNSNLLYQALGTHSNREASYGDVHQLQDGDAFLLCTDGFWHILEQVDVEQTLCLVNSPKEWLTLIEKSSIKPGNGDNYSAIAIWIGEPQDVTRIYSSFNKEQFISIKR